MTIVTLNPHSWGSPALVVEYHNGAFGTIVEASYSGRDSVGCELGDINLSDYCLEEYPVDTRFHEECDDAYPIDDPGCCFYESFRPRTS